LSRFCDQVYVTYILYMFNEGAMNGPVDISVLISVHTLLSKSPRAFSFKNASSLMKQFIPVVNRHFCWHFPSKHRTKSPLNCNRRPRLVKPQHALSFFYLRRHFNSQSVLHQPLVKHVRSHTLQPAKKSQNTNEQW
jgi:hypothetical protein